MKKKILSLILAVCVVLGLSACGGEEEVEDALVCTMEQSGMTFTMRMDAKGDTVTNVEQETVVSTEGFTEIRSSSFARLSKRQPRLMKPSKVLSTLRKRETERSVK